MCVNLSVSATNVNKAALTGMEEGPQLPEISFYSSPFNFAPSSANKSSEAAS